MASVTPKSSKSSGASVRGANVDVFREAQAALKPPGQTGWWTRAEQQLDVEQWDALVEAAWSPEISHRAIATVLRQWGIDVTPGAVGHWRRNRVR